MDEKKRNLQNNQEPENRRSESAAQSDETQDISVGQNDNLQPSNDDENFYQNRERGNMPSEDERNARAEESGSLY